VVVGEAGAPGHRVDRARMRSAIADAHGAPPPPRALRATLSTASMIFT
jgi:hypothetical protein